MVAAYSVSILQQVTCCNL